MPGSDLIIDGAIVLDGTILPDEYCEYYGRGCFSARMVREALAETEGAVVVYMNSLGGVAVEGEAIRAALMAAGDRVTLVVAGFAASAASLAMLGAARRYITAGSQIMIHDPSTIAFGNAAAIGRTADNLEDLAEIYADVYAIGTENDPATIRDWMKAETWFSARQSIENGFAHQVADVAQEVQMIASDLTAATFKAVPDPRLAFQEMQNSLEIMFERTQFGVGIPPASQSANAATNKGANMPDPIIQGAPVGGAIPTTVAPAVAPIIAAAGAPAVTPVVEPVADAPIAPVVMIAEPLNVAQVQQAERDRASGITMAARPFMESGRISQDIVDQLIADGSSVEMAGSRILATMAANEPVLGGRTAGQVSVGREAIENTMQGVGDALTARISNGTPSEIGAAHMNLSIVEMAAAVSGQTVPRFGDYRGRENVLMVAFNGTSDFPGILDGAVNRVLEERDQLVERTFAPIAREMRFNDFRAHSVVKGDSFPGLKKIAENGEIKFGTMTDNAETISLVAYASGINISRQAMVNDDLGALQDMLDNVGDIIPSFEETMFWQTVLANPSLADTVALWHGTHGNLAGSGTAITEAAVSAGRAALRKMKTKDGNVIHANAPTFLIVGPDKETEAEKFVSTVLSTKTDDVNPFSGRLQVVVTAEIVGNPWYLNVGGVRSTHAFKYGYLDGQSAPRVRTADPFGVQGVQMSVEHDFAVGAVNHRGTFKNAGA